MATLTVFTAAAQAASKRQAGEGLRISGFSVTTYIVHRCSPTEVQAAFESGALEQITGPTTYADKLRAGSALRYSRATPLERDYSQSLQSFTLRRERELSQNVLWLTDSGLIVTALPMRFQVGELRSESGRDLDFAPDFRLQRPATVPDLIALINQTQSDPFASTAIASSVKGLSALGINPTDSRPVESIIGLDIWSIAASEGRLDSEAFIGSRDCAQYSWPLAALMNYASDHVANGFASAMSHEEVFQQMRHGQCFMGDHGIFINSSCCLEVTHFGDWTPLRSWDRIEFYGYDSSSLYLWSIAILRAETYKATSERFGALVLELTGGGTSSSVDEAGVYDECLRALRLLDGLDALHLLLKERRSQDIDSQFKAVLGDEVWESSARGRVESVRALLIERSNREEDSQREAGVTRLTLGAAVLAVASIPGAVQQFLSWSHEHDYKALWWTASLMVLALIVVALVTRTGFRRRNARTRSSQADVRLPSPQAPQ